MLQRTIPSSGEQLPAIGIGTWQTFDLGESAGYPQLTQVLQEMHSAGGRLIDSSPMYGRAEKVVGDITTAMPERDDFFYATKVWTEGKQQGIRQMEDSMKYMRRSTVDLMQIHNLLDWKTHLPVLRDWKERGIIRYIGITHYTDGMHGALEDVFSTTPVDFVQFNYSIEARHAEKRLLKAAAGNGVATIINRPLGEGRLFRKVAGKALPGWAVEAGIHSWGAFFLAFIISNPAVTCVIPATSSPQHAKDNFCAGSIAPLTESFREKMADYLERL